MYPPELVKPMKAELTDVGFSELLTPEAVDEAVKQSGTTLVVINSVCGCAASNARPGAIQALENKVKPDHLYTSFAGVDTDAVEKARAHMVPFPPSSPSMAIFKDGELVHMLERHHIEGRPADMVAENLKQAFDDYCA